MSPTIFYIGNFTPPRSTENAYRYGFERAGIRVIPIQQEAAREIGPGHLYGYQAGDVLLYTRTHNRTHLGTDWTDYWRQLEEEGVQTATVHLDVFVGVTRRGMGPEWDDPMFTTGTVFTPDPALGAYIEDDHTRHVWLPPAADVRAGDPKGEPIDGLAGKVVFVGSVYGTPQIHPEYPFRTELLRWLESTYGLDFYRYGGGSPFGAPRGKPLWDIYASDCIIVGDSCFAGERPYYWSDRIPETLAHGGLLTHKAVEGLSLDYPGLATWEDFGDLAGQIGAWRRDRHYYGLAREHNAAEVRRRHTYVHRAAAILMELDVPYLTTAP